MEGLHPILVSGLRILACKHPITVVEGVRSKERQRALYEAGKSWTMNSRHLTGNAVDDYLGTWELEPYERLCESWKRIEDDVVCGCDWAVKDCVHFEIVKIPEK